MGWIFSKPAPPAPLLDRPWRPVDWSIDKQRLLQDVNNFKTPTEDQVLRILLHGPVGAGKSSFINSVESVLQDKMCVQALVDSVSHDSFTKKYTTYRIPRGTAGASHPFVLNDIVGLNQTSSRSQLVHVKDVKRVLKGHVKDGYAFNQSSTISKRDPCYVSEPTENHKVHVLVSVMDASRDHLVKNSLREALRAVRFEATELGIPQVAVFTKIDEVCPEIKEDVKNVYRSKILKQRMEQYSADVGLPMNCIFPVKNYHEEINLNKDMDILILSALTAIIHKANDFRQHHHHDG